MDRGSSPGTAIPPRRRRTESVLVLGRRGGGRAADPGLTYLPGIALVVGRYEVVSNVIDFQFSTLVAARYVEDAAMAAFLGRFASASIVASLVAQLALTTWILRKWGPRVGLLVLPLVLGLGSAAFLALPLLTVVAAAFFADGALNYSLNQTAKEVLYTPTDELTKYQAKAFIDMFLMRTGQGGRLGAHPGGCRLGVAAGPLREAVGLAEPGGRNRLVDRGAGGGPPLCRANATRGGRCARLRRAAAGASGKHAVECSIAHPRVVGRLRRH